MATPSAAPDPPSPRRKPPPSIWFLGVAAALTLCFIGFRALRSVPPIAPARSGDQATTSDIERPAPVAFGRAAGRDASADPEHDSSDVSDDVEAAEAALERASQHYAAAQAAVARAQSELDESEHAVEDLERYVADLKARGEDPVDHADEGLALFNPAFDGYEKATKDLERAEALEALALQERQSAEQQREAARRSIRDRP